MIDLSIFGSISGDTDADVQGSNQTETPVSKTASPENDQSISGGVWQAALEEMISPVVIIDENAEIILFNDAMEDLIGVSEREAKQMELWEMVRTDETHDSKTTALERVLETEEPIRGLETKLLTHRDELLQVIVSNAPIYDRNDKLRGAVAAFQDVTELRKKSSNLSKHNKQSQTELAS